MNRRRLLLAGGASALAAIGNIRGTAQAEVSDMSLPSHEGIASISVDLTRGLLVSYGPDDRIHTVSQHRENRWHALILNVVDPPPYDGAIIYQIHYGISEPFDIYRRSVMPFGTPEHESMSQFNKRVLEFFDWSFAEFEQADETKQ